ncbi:MAG: hypothetical protein KC416_11085 [Myxococcales bacterium]|nr:hypothetical protein [Myxococcales bacterium]
MSGTGPGPEVAEFTMDIGADSAFFKGHFDGFPIFPAVAQFDDLILPRIEERWPDLGSLARVVRVKYQKPIRPGMRVILICERDGTTVRFNLSSDGPCASGVLQFGK